MKKVLIIVVTLAMVFAVSAAALAETAEPAEAAAKTQKLEKGERLRILFEKYYADGVEALETVQTAHEQFHEGAVADREALREAVTTDFDAIKAAIESGDVTKREGRIQLINLRMDIRNMRNEIDEVILAKIEAQAPIHDRLAEVRTEVKTLLEADPVDEAAVEALLIESLGLLESHLVNDQLFHGQYITIATSYGY